MGAVVYGVVWPVMLALSLTVAFLPLRRPVVKLVVLGGLVALTLAWTVAMGDLWPLGPLFFSPAWIVTAFRLYDAVQDVRSAGGARDRSTSPP